MHKFCARAIIDNYIVQKISRCGAGSKEIFNDEVTTVVTDIIPDDIIIDVYKRQAYGSAPRFLPSDSHQRRFSGYWRELP